MATTKKVARSEKRSSSAPASERRMKAASTAPVDLADTVIRVTPDDECPLPAQPTAARFVRIEGDNESLLLNPSQALEALEGLRGFLASLGPYVEKTTLQLTALEERVRDRRRFMRRDAGDIIDTVRSQLAELWWYGDRTLGEGSGVTPDVARDEMANLVCQLGMDLNQLAKELHDLAAMDREIAITMGAMQP